MRRIATNLALLAAWTAAAGGCASILGIQEQTFDGTDADVGSTPDATTAPEASADAGNEGDGATPEATLREDDSAPDAASPDDATAMDSGPEAAVADAMGVDAAPEASIDAAPEAAAGCPGGCLTPPPCYSSPGSCKNGICSYGPASATTSCSGGMCNGSGSCL